ncbi:Glucoamylase, intracellular sporulation-specific [Allomyces javanicus]|nr:Glucoamylase, intracellular sporulation-specific [Allomyces javanicus]
MILAGTVAAALLVAALSCPTAVDATTAHAVTPGWNHSELTTWVAAQKTTSWHYLLANVSPPGTKTGCVVAAQSKQEPDYWYYWTRDGALVMDVLVHEYATAHDPSTIQRMEKVLWDYIEFNTVIQLVKNRSVSPRDPLGLGEPKFNVDGTAFKGSWGRPQHDGPALRASTVMRFVRAYLRRGGSLERLYHAVLPADSLVKRDLEMVSHNLGAANFDLWEEVRGEHLYTNLVQRRALVEGTHFAQFFNDSGAAQWYHMRAEDLTPTIDHYWNAARGYFDATRHMVGGHRYKSSNLDVAVILAALHTHGDRTDGVLAVDDDRVLATAAALAEHHRRVFAINHRVRPDLPPAIGRYEEDQFMGGNPWFLCTLAMAELHFRVAVRIARDGFVAITSRSVAFFTALPTAPLAGFGPGTVKKSDAQFAAILEGLLERGDGFLVRARVHMGEGGRMDEQIDRWTGKMRSAKDLTWSYAAFITAANARDEARAAVRVAEPHGVADDVEGEGRRAWSFVRQD